MLHKRGFPWKKIFIFLLIIILMMVVGCGIFIATFDANQYRSNFTKKIEALLGRPVEFKDIFLYWDKGPAFRLKGLSIYSNSQALEVPEATFDRVTFLLALTPDGFSETPFSLKNLFKVRSVEIEGAGAQSLTFQSKGIPYAIIEDVDVLLKEPSYSEPMEFEAQMSLLSQEPNLNLKGSLKKSASEGFYILEDVEVDSDLGLMDFSKLTDSNLLSPETLLPEKFSGKMTGQIRYLKLSPHGIAEVDSSFHIQEGRLSLSALPTPLEDIDLSADLTRDQMTIQSFSTTFGRGKVSATGKIKGHHLKSPKTVFKLNAERLALEKIFLQPNPRARKLIGNLSLLFDGQMEGVSRAVILKTLTGKGKAVLTEGALLNLNILRMIIEKLSQKVPNAPTPLYAYLPGLYQYQISLPHTVFQPIEFPVNVGNGGIAFSNIRVASTGFEIYATGQMGFGGDVHFQAMLVMDRPLSNILMQLMPNLQYIADRYGRLSIPVVVTGTVHNLQVIPDMDYVVSRVVQAKGQELLTSVFQGTV